MSGEDTEVDRTVIDEIGDPLIHLIRNSIDHGIEDKATRIARGKDENGTVKTFEREIKTKRGIVKTKEHGYYCSHCRKVFFPSPKKSPTIQRKLQP